MAIVLGLPLEPSTPQRKIVARSQAEEGEPMVNDEGMVVPRKMTLAIDLIGIETNPILPITVTGRLQTMIAMPMRSEPT